MEEYKTTIGIECHVQLNTKTKLFSAVDNDAVDKEPNSCVSPIDYALPGMLPVLNKAAIEKCVRAGLAMNCKINLHIEHAHLEEDAGKLTHFGTYSLVDLNRAGTPLIEIVSMPDIHSPAQARAYCEELHRLMMYAGVTNGDLYQGNMRFDINVSVSKTDKLGTRTETKNLNSFRSIERAVEYEVKRQIEVLEKGGKVKQETRGWNDATGKTTSQRSKEEAQDYRYMPEPDVPPVVLEQSYVDKVEASMPMMPDEYRSKFGLLNLDHSESEAILNYPILAQRLNEVCDKNISLAPRVAHWFSGVLLSEENQDKNFALATAEELAELSEMVEKKELSSTGAKAVLMEMYDRKNTAKTAHTLAKEMNLLQENDEGALEAIIDEVLQAPECAKAADDVRNGEMKAIGFLVGQVMKKSKGKANPATVNELIKKKLS